MPLDLPKNVLPSVTGAITAFARQDPDIDPNNVLEIDKDWTLVARWNISGPGASYLAGGDWHLRINIESMGGGDEKTLLNVTHAGGDFLAGSNATNVMYEHTFNVLARNPNGIPAVVDRINQPGVFRLVMILTHDDPVFPHPDRVAGFMDGPMLQFYEFGA